MMMLGLMLLRVHMPIGRADVRGRAVKTVYLSFPERLFMQRINVYSIAGVLLLTTVTGMMSTTFEIMVVAIAFGILALPVRCILTTEGVAINNVVFRQWKEFAGFSCERRRIRLEGRDGTRPLMLPLMLGRQQEVMAALRQHLRPTTSSGTSRSLAKQTR
jgi:hypothetical protein